MPAVLATTSVQLARAHAVGKALTRRGWSARMEERKNHPGALSANSYGRLGVRVLVVTLGARNGQLVEIISTGVPAKRSPTGGHSAGARPSWRLTAYNPPASAVLATANAAWEASTELGVLETAGWHVDRPTTKKIGVPRATRFTKPDSTVVLAFHAPTYCPPCPTCAPEDDCGDCGGWIIAASCFMEASCHTPESVIAAFVGGLPDRVPGVPSLARGVVR